MNIQEYLTGLQHIGIPAVNLDSTVAFYQRLGFTVEHRQVIDRDGTIRVAFLRLAGLVLEFYQQEGENADEVRRRGDGHVDHFALDVTDVQAVFDLARSMGLELLDQELQHIPFFQRGVTFFRVRGPNGEIVEFNQKL